jgi:glycine/D-amino acid oxidase-like deaminating enzyme
VRGADRDDPDGPGYPGYLGAAQLRQHGGADIRTLTSDAARVGFPMTRFGPDETILHQPAAGHFSPRRYISLATQSARANGATITAGTVRALRTSTTGVEAERDGVRRGVPRQQPDTEHPAQAGSDQAGAGGHNSSPSA